MNNLNLYFTILAISISIVLLFLLIKKNRQLKKSNDERYHLLEKYRGIMSVKTELKKLNKQKENIESNINNLKTDFEERNLFIDNIEEIEKYIDLLQNEYRKKQIYYERITKIEEYIYEKELEKQKQDNEILELEKKTNRLRVDFETKQLSYVSLESIEKEISLKKEEEKAVTREIENLRDLYKTKKLTYDNLIKEISILEEDIEDLSYGLYKPHFEFDSPEGYKSKITKIKEEQRNAIRNKKAAKCNTNWEVNGSKRGIRRGMSIFHEPGKIRNLPRKNGYDITREKSFHVCPC